MRMMQGSTRSRRLRIAFAATIALFAAWIAPGATNAETPKYRHSLAVAIGIDRYADSAWRTLRHARAGAEAMAELLRQGGFEVEVLLDEGATKEKILSALADAARHLQPGDRVLIYFAGHGYTEAIAGSDRGFIVPHDGKDIATYISMDELQYQSKLMGNALHQLFVMDACYGGLFALTRDRLGTYARRPGLVEDFMRRKARQYITAGGKDQTVLDGGSDGHSVFTGEVLNAVGEGFADKNADGIVTFAELASYLETAASNQHQTPSYGSLPGHQSGSFMFAVDSPGRATEQLLEQTPGIGSRHRSRRQSSAEPSTEPSRMPSKPPQTYKVREGVSQTLDEIGATVAVAFSTVEGLPVATVIVSFPGGPGRRQPAFEPGAPLIFEAGDVSLQGTVLGIDWDLKETTFTLGQANGQE